MDSIQQIQEDEYNFPYHHLCSFEDGIFSQSRNLSWGYIYLSYVHFVISILVEKKPKTVLEVGCGDGKFLYEANKNLPNTKIVGVDYSTKAVALSRFFNPTLSVHAINIIEDTSFNQTFDAVVLIEVLEHIPPKDVSNFLKSIKKLLKKNGIFILTVPSDNTPVHKKHYQHFNKETITKILEEHFKVDKIYYLNTQSKVMKIIRRLMDNKYYSIHNGTLLTMLFNMYKKYFLHSDNTSSSRICVTLSNK